MIKFDTNTSHILLQCAKVYLPRMPSQESQGDEQKQRLMSQHKGFKPLSQTALNNTSYTFNKSIRTAALEIRQKN